MDTISLDELKQMIGELFIENILLKKKMAYLENMVKQLSPKEEGNGQGKEAKPGHHQETKKWGS